MPATLENINLDDLTKKRGSSDRTKSLRIQTTEMPERISIERAKLLTEIYPQIENLPTAIKRAKSFEYIFKNKKIYIDKKELILGERGDFPKAVPTYPEICCHTKQDLEILNSREKTPYRVSSEDIEFYEENIIPFWKGKTIREKIFNEMSEEWINAFEAGVFTEFMEQRAPGHTVADGKIFEMGLKDFIDKIDFELNKDRSEEEINQLKAMKIVANAMIDYSKRHIEELKKLLKNETDDKIKKDIQELIKICERVPENKPKTFHEALQHYWFLHIGVITELPTWDSFSPGKLDMHLYPFYKNDIEKGILTKEKAKELLECFWIKFHNHPAPPKVGVTAQESGTYTDFAQINLGGVKEDGTSNVNELTYLLLDVIKEMRLVQPNASIQVSKKNPDLFIKKAIEIIKTGFGQPSVFNTDTVIVELLRQGKSLIDARLGGTSGCVETGAFGKENYSLTGYFNLPKVLEITLFNGIDVRTGKKIGIETGDVTNFDTFDELYSAFEKQLEYFINIKIEGNLKIEKIYAEDMPSPFLSILIDDCIVKAKDYNAGGARYNSSYIQGVGTGTITDSLSVIKQFIYEDKIFFMNELLEMIKNNFEGYDAERLTIWNKSHKYGNDDDYADRIMQKVFHSYLSFIDGRKNYKGGHFRVNMLPTTCHVYFGSVMIASPDGRKAFEPTSEGISPVQGADRNGPTAVIKSAAKMDHQLTGGTLLNIKFTPQILKTDNGINAVTNLIRTYFKLDGHHIQFNVIDAETLRKAQQEPEKYKDLIVRVAGYSDYFSHLGKKLQDEIIQRTEHEDF
jgi:formate C-acetyltransferase